MAKKLAFALSVVAVIVVITVLSLIFDTTGGEKNQIPIPNINDLPVDANGVTQVNWIRISPPPNADGPCYAFFIDGDYQGFSAVWCD